MPAAPAIVVRMSRTLACWKLRRGSTSRRPMSGGGPWRACWRSRTTRPTPPRASGFPASASSRPLLFPYAFLAVLRQRRPAVAVEMLDHDRLQANLDQPVLSEHGLAFPRVDRLVP